MPIYCYTNKDGVTIERSSSVSDFAREIEVDGELYTVDVCAQQGHVKQTTGNWPLKSEACGVGHDQVAEAQAADIAKGLPANYTKDGRKIFNSASERKKWCEAYGFYDKNAGYSDPRRK